MTEVLRKHSSRPDEDVATFVDALTFSWLIAGTDAHAKNYSLLLSARGQVRLAPLYDLASALPYPDMDPGRLKLAMKLGDEYAIRHIARRHFEQLAKALDLDPAQTWSRARRLAERMLERVPGLCEREKEQGLAHPIVDRLRDELLRHGELCLKALEG